jgi:predicted Zn-dependent peptidase
MFEFPTRSLPEEELQVVKDMINNKRAFLFEKIDGVIAQLYLMKMYRLGPSFLKEYEARIEKVSAEEAKNAVGEVFEKNQGYIVVVGNSDLAETLKAWTEKQGGVFEMRPAQSIIEP